MAQKPHRPVSVRMAARSRPGQDMVVVRSQAAQFPAVGMTLRSYQYDSRDYYGRAGAPVVKTSPLRRFLQYVTLRRFIVVLAVAVLIGGGWLGGKFLYNAHKLFGGSLFSVLGTTRLKGEDSGRVNILLAGNSSDDPGHSGANLTDSIMVLSIDTRHNTALLLSVPRDLWVHIPNDGHEKINDAYVVGQAERFHQSGYPDGGMGMLEKIVEQDMGMPIDYYALIDYNAFRDSVNAVGGIDITVNSSDPRGLYDPSIDYATHKPLVKLSNGRHHLSGQQALDLARARGDSYYSYGFPASDFDRTQHQRQMLIALKDKAVSIGVLANPAKLSKLSDAIGNNVKTDLSLGDVRRLYDLVKPINSKNIKSLSLNSANGKDLLKSYASPTGESALIPAAGVDNYSAIQLYIKQQISSDPVVRENAQVVVLNGTGTFGLAAREQKTLETKNLDVVSVGDAQSTLTTTIIDNSSGKKPATRQLLVSLFGNKVSTTDPYDGAYQADFIVVLGNEQSQKVSSNIAN